MQERLQKILARSGYGSRRSCEELISAHRVTVNGQVAILGTRADHSIDTIVVDKVVLSKKPIESIYIALHKPEGVLSDEDPNDNRPTVRGMVPVEGHLFSVGRLDFDSEGLILLTNDGELANRLTHPRYGHEKEYRVLVNRKADEQQLKTLRRGVVLADGYRTAPAQVEFESDAGRYSWLRFVLKEGRKRQIREMCSRIGLPVSRIIRVRIGTLLLGTLKPGKWRPLTQEEIDSLKRTALRSDTRPTKSVHSKPIRRYPAKKPE
jgi:23S rRNA pseudouridine2605 synthase